MSDFKIIEGLYYTREHEWLKAEKDSGGSRDIFKMGITDYAQDALGDIVYLDISLATGDIVEKGQEIGVVESVKAVEELYSPVDGKIKAVHSELKEKPEKINADAYASWIVSVEPESEDAFKREDLMDSQGYSKYIKSL